MVDRIDESWYARPPGLPSHESAGGVVGRVVDGEVRLAFITEKGGGTYVLPKGHVEPGESAEEAAVREIAEEAGLHHIRLLDRLGTRERLSFDKSGWKITHYFLFASDDAGERPTDPAVVGETVWWPLHELPPLFWPDQADLIEEHRVRIETLLRERT